MMAWSEKPYAIVSLDTIQIGRLKTYPKQVSTFKNNLLIVACLVSGHIQLEPIYNLSSAYIASALKRIKQKFSTTIVTIYSDNYSSLRKESLGMEMEELRPMRVIPEEILAEHNQDQSVILQGKELC